MATTTTASLSPAAPSAPSDKSLIPPTILLLGDSQTQYSMRPSLNGFGCQLVERYERKADVVARGFSGYTSRDLVRYLDSLVERVEVGCGGTEGNDGERKKKKRKAGDGSLEEVGSTAGNRTRLKVVGHEGELRLVVLWIGCNDSINEYVTEVSDWDRIREIDGEIEELQSELEELEEKLEEMEETTEFSVPAEEDDHVAKMHELEEEVDEMTGRVECLKETKLEMQYSIRVDGKEESLLLTDEKEKQHVPPNEFYSNLVHILRRLTLLDGPTVPASQRPLILVLSPTPVLSHLVPSHRNANKERYTQLALKAVQAVSAELCAREESGSVVDFDGVRTSGSMVFLDLYKAFIDPENDLRDLLQDDGLHISPQGYDLVMEEIKEAIETRQQLEPSKMAMVFPDWKTF